MLVSLVLATAYGCAFHVLVGRRLWQWPLFVGVATLGFFAGYAAGVALGVEWLRVGSVPLAAASTGALVCLLLAWYFSAPEAKGQGPRAEGQEERING
jgi:hypothetical protein